MTTAQEIYSASIRHLPPPERLRLAAMILQDLIPPLTPEVDDSDAWTDEDLRDLNAFALDHLSALDPGRPPIREILDRPGAREPRPGRAEPGVRLLGPDEEWHPSRRDGRDFGS